MEDLTNTSTDAFAERIFSSVLGAMDCLTIALGDRLGLYDALAEHGPLTAEELSRHAEIDARYAREWLEQQAVAGLVDVARPADSGESRQYGVNDAQRAVLCDRSLESYLTPLTQVLAAAGAQLDALETAYRTGGGVGWASYGPRMRRGQADANRALFLTSLPEVWLPAVPALHERLTEGTRVADVGCGDGWSSIGIASGYPASTVDGFDLDPDSVAAAHVNAADHGVADRTTFRCVDAATVDDAHGYGLVTAFECVHDMPDPVSVLATMRSMAEPDGWVVVVDERVPETFTGSGDPVEQLMYGYSVLVCLPDGMSHQPTRATGTVMRPEVLRAYAQEAGFADIEVLPIENEVFRAYRLLTPAH
ncbi:methyltransferase domain-containing protein [Mumia zhuanghuii]|uniref:Methyltransferase domain-containing protein n=2 Tax=Mumia TaxID=1546255 RepID=A0ABW1QRR0_9ACTN|nr:MULTISPECIES: methyltransferase domain-containing protein [Mumia]KAA1420654.1 methyltransferase domain-containing protein [Mumia zhuanghuii]